MQYHIGDQLICRVNQDRTIVFDVDWNDSRYLKFPTQKFKIIGFYKSFYIILTPPPINNSLMLDQELLNKWSNAQGQPLKIDLIYIDDWVFLVKEGSVGGRETFNPYVNTVQCNVCLDYVPWADPNQEDGSFICWVCRNTRLFK